MKNKKIYGLLAVVIVGLFIYNGSYAKSDQDMVDVSIRTMAAGEKLRLDSQSGFVLKNESGKTIRTLDEKFLLVKPGPTKSLLLGKGAYAIVNNKDCLYPAAGDNIKVEGRKYRGGFKLVESNGFYLVNHIDLEHYIYGVVPREIGSASPEEALKAQAVASRTYVKKNIYNKHKGQGFNMCNTTHCQVYGGLDGEYPKTNKAVEATRGEMVYFGSDLANTVYHANNGGYMESSKGAWGGELAYLQASYDIYSLNQPNSTWVYEITRSELSKKLKNAGINIGSIRDIEILEYTDGRRVKELCLIGSGGRKNIRADKFRSILGNGIFKSSYFEIEGKEGLADKRKVSVITTHGLEERWENELYYIDESGNINKYPTDKGTSSGAISGETIVFKGKGYGHGVGLSQNGAIQMARESFNYKEILRHYYKGVEIY